MGLQLNSENDLVKCIWEWKRWKFIGEVTAKVQRALYGDSLND